MAPQKKPQPDFIPAEETPDFIPAEPAAPKAAAPKTIDTPVKPKGFLRSLYENSPLSTLEAIDTATSSPQNFAKGLGSLVSGVGSELGRSAKQLKEAWDTPNNEPLKAIDRTLYAIPGIGGTLKSADEDAKAGRYGDAAGKGLGIIGSELLGGVLANKIPSTKRAGAVFDDLKTNLKNQPVPLNKALGPLQDIAVNDAAGGGAPGAASKLIGRSQATFPMDYPEARLFQENLGNLSRDDRSKLAGSMGGSVTQLNGALYDDILKAAEAGGMGPEYEAAMREFKQASQLKDLVKKGAAAAGIGSALYEGKKKLLGSIK